MKLHALGIDLGKAVFHLVGLDSTGKVVIRKKCSRTQLLAFTANLQVQLIGMESCSGSHFLGRALREQGHEVRLMPAQYVKPYVQTNKSDFLDAEAIAEAVQRPKMRFVPIKKNSSVHPKHCGRLVATRGASVDTLDHFAEREGIDRVNLIKIDVDGQELQVLRGALRVLKEFQPLLVIEISPYVQAEHNNSFSTFVWLLRDAGYSLQDATTWNPLPLDAGRLEALIPDGASINAIARPKNRL